MRILYVYKDYYPVLGGIENHIKMLAEGLTRRGYQVQVLVTNTSPKTVTEEINGVPVIKAGCPFRISGAPISPALYAWLRRLEPDIAHLHFPNPPGELGQLFFGRSRCFVLTYHSDIVRQKYLLRVYKPFLWWVLARADAITVSNPTYIETSLYLRPFADKCTVIHHGQDLSRFAHPNPDSVAAIRAPYTPRPLLLFVGRLRYYKGLEVLIEAMRGINAHLLIVGDGPMRQEWEALTVELALTKRVAFLGHIPDAELPAYYQACDLFVLPSTHRSETWGAVQVEAMACGKPVVCTELGTGTSYVNLHEKTGLVVPPRDSAALAQAINQLLADPDLRRRLGERGRQRAEQEFSKEIMVEATIALYERLLSNGR
ncbi:MAG: glycosyltransferase [Ardenticatenia bacterium]|nr:glycosyltransferase [Ardenticatenia bacterium]